MPEWLTALLSILGIFSIIFLPTILPARFEKRLIWPYAPIEGAPPTHHAPVDDNPYAVGRAVESTLQLTPFALRESEAAILAQFDHVGSFKHGKGGMYRILYDFGRSPNGEVLALISGGTLAGIPVLNTWFYTLTDDGRCLVTLGDQKGSEIDLGGLTSEALVAGADFNKLLDWHRRRIAASPASVVRFSEADPLGDLLSFRRRRTDRLEERGYVFYLDAERTIWRYTLKGALAFAFLAYFQGMRRVFLPDKVIGYFRTKPRA